MLYYCGIVKNKKLGEILTMGRRLADEIAEKFALDLETVFDRFIPSIRDLSERYGVSLKTMHSAVQLLKKQGIIVCRRGQRIRRKDEPVPVSAPKVPALDTIIESIKKNIDEGLYPQGTTLPKISFFVAKFSVANRTVAKAFRILEGENILYRKGRYWVVGYPPPSPSENVPRQPPVLLLFQLNEYSWQNLSSGGRNQKFCTAFEREAESHGFQIVPVFIQPPTLLQDVFPFGEKALLETIRSIGPRYYGILIAVRFHDFMQFDSLVPRLLKFDKPVVWFDPYNTGSNIRYGSKQFSRCSCSETQVIELAVTFLKDAGHRRVVYPQMWREKSDWRQRRGEKIVSIAARHGVSVERIINPFIQDIDYHTAAPWMHSNLLDLVRNGTDEMRELARMLQGHLDDEPLARMFTDSTGTGLNFPYNDIMHLFSTVHPSTPPNLEEHTLALGSFFFAAQLHVLPEPETVTAIIAPVDFDAYHFYFWLRRAGLAVPQRYSLLSFENMFTPLPFPLPITSVDFGFNYLGYAAFHLLFDDMHIRRDRKGSVYSMPRIIRRGSIQYRPENEGNI
jgi:DNA-binding transcriptional regulator YhcF (GntR family)